MSVTRVLRFSRVVQPGLFRVSGNSEGKRNEADTSGECCLFDDMHLPLSEVDLVRDGFWQQACQRSEARRCEKTCSFRAEKCDAFA